MLDHMVVLFLTILRNLHIVFHSGCTNLHYHQQFTKVPFSLHPLQHLLFVGFLVIDILTWVTSYLIVVLICISLITGDIERLSCACACLLWKNVYSSLLPIFQLDFFFIFYFFDTALYERFVYFGYFGSCQLLHLQIFSPILKVVFLYCLWFLFLCKSFEVSLGPICLFLFLFPFL